MSSPLRECMSCHTSLRVCFIRHANIGRHCCADCQHEHIVKEIEVS